MTLAPSDPINHFGTSKTETDFKTLLGQCDQEPIQYAAAIQPRFALLVLDAKTMIIQQASANCQSLLGIDAQQLIDQGLDGVFDDENLSTLLSALNQHPLKQALCHVLRVPKLKQNATAFHLFAHLTDDNLLLEFEPCDCQAETSLTNTIYNLRNVLQYLQQTASLEEFLNIAVVQLRSLSGFDRVMAYRFADDGSGEVLAESKSDGLESFLGLHYPASDIPAPARRLFGLSALRHLPDVNYLPVDLLPTETAKAVDLSRIHSRSVSQMYTLYLRNMGVQATLVMPLLKEDQLWGLISCMHHSTPHYLPYAQRIPLEWLSQMLSQQLKHRESLDQLEYRKRFDAILAQLIKNMSETEDLHTALLVLETNLLSEMKASGVAVCLTGQLKLSGATPTHKQVLSLLDWLDHQSDDIFADHHLSQSFPPAAAYSEVASGVLAIRLSRKGQNWVVWFRPEKRQEVHWAGDPQKPVSINDTSNELRLTPRVSFALWKQTVEGQSQPWHPCELDYASRLRYAIFGVIVERVWLLAQMNAELERSNLELDSFAYASSHDMKEPLRGIYNYAEFLKMEEADHLSEKGRQRLDTILKLTERMVVLLDSLLQYSRIGKNQLELNRTPLEPEIRKVVKMMLDAHPSESIEILIQPDLPSLLCDRLWVQTIFQNLIANSIKYNDQAQKRIEIGCNQSIEPAVFYIRDNGIGIDPAHHHAVFQLFNRLNERNAYGGGSGAGLSIVKRVVERHGGQIWLESSLGLGTTFFFTLSPMRTLEDLHG